MGSVQTRVEAKVFEETPPWDLKTIVSRTDLTEDQVNCCWRMWVQHRLVVKGQLSEEAFYEALNASSDQVRCQARKVFELLDKNDDNHLEFPEIMIFLFHMGDLSDEQQLRRSFLLYDRNESGKITKQEMVETLDLLELLEMEHDEDGNVVIPDDVENLFSLMDFGHDDKIDEKDFMQCTIHYRKLGKMLSISLLEDNRKHVIDRVKEFMEKKNESQS